MWPFIGSHGLNILSGARDIKHNRWAVFAITEATAVGLFPLTLPLDNINELIIVTHALIVTDACIGFLITEYPNLGSG